MLMELGAKLTVSTIFSDNQGAIKIMKNEASSGRTKHVDIKLQFLKEAVLKGEVDIRYVNTADNVSDIFTKPLNRLAFNKLSKFLVQ